MNILYNIKGTLIITALVSSIFVRAPTWAQGLNNNAWSPQPSNRAAIASLIRQVEQDDTSSSSGALGFVGSNVTQLICGSNSGEGTGGSSANAQANSSCIILNNSDGALNINQDSDGEQSADANSTAITTIDETINETNGTDEVLATLAGE